MRQLLRDVKGIFGVENVYFLVSVSSEAARALNLNGLAERNEFNSSFEAVLELGDISPAESAALLLKRHQPEDVGRALGVLAGGVPRDVVRLAELLESSPGASDADPLTHAVVVAMHKEAGELRQAVIEEARNADDGISDGSKLRVFHSLHDVHFTDEAFAAFALRAYDEHWYRGWEPSFERKFGEEWRRLLIRLVLAGSLVSDPEGNRNERALAAQRVIAASTESAAVARELLGQYLGASLSARAAWIRRWRRRLTDDVEPLRQGSGAST